MAGLLYEEFLSVEKPGPHSCDTKGLTYRCSSKRTKKHHVTKATVARGIQPNPLVHS